MLYVSETLSHFLYVFVLFLKTKRTHWQWARYKNGNISKEKFARLYDSFNKKHNAWYCPAWPNKTKKSINMYFYSFIARIFFCECCDKLADFDPWDDYKLYISGDINSCKSFYCFVCKQRICKCHIIIWLKGPYFDFGLSKIYLCLVCTFGSRNNQKKLQYDVMTGKKIDINKLEPRLRDIPKWRQQLLSASHGNPNKYIPPLPTFIPSSNVSETSEPSNVSQIFSTLTVSEPTQNTKQKPTQQKPTRKKQLTIHSMLQPLNKMPPRPQSRNFAREQQYQQWQMQQVAMQQHESKQQNVSQTEQKQQQHSQKDNVPVQIYHIVSQTNQNQQQSQFVTFQPTQHLQQHVSQTTSSQSSAPSLSQTNYNDLQPPHQQRQQIHPITHSNEQSDLSPTSALLQRQALYANKVDELKRQIERLEYQKTKEGAQAIYAHYHPQSRVSNKNDNNESNKNRKRRDVHSSPSDNPLMRAVGNKTHRRRKNGLLYLYFSSKMFLETC